jgi:hypothetical protein
MLSPGERHRTKKPQEQPDGRAIIGQSESSNCFEATSEGFVVLFSGTGEAVTFVTRSASQSLTPPGGGGSASPNFPLMKQIGQKSLLCPPFVTQPCARGGGGCAG